jgi:flavin reductase (DIM6/NTAB) family NADH-FMN oxidoreductase RutF
VPDLSLTLSDLSPEQVYLLLTGIVVPRPIALVSSLDTKGIRNLAPFSYFQLGGVNPPSVVFSPVTTKGRDKDTLSNIRQTGEYVINLVTASMKDPMNLTSPTYRADVDEWLESGLTPIPSSLVKPERVLESKVALECRLHQIVPHGIGEGSANYVIGEVLLAHLKEGLWDGKEVRGFSPISRLGGADYLDLASLTTFTLPRPPLDVEKS